MAADPLHVLFGVAAGRTAALAVRHHAEIAGVDELQVLHRRVRHAVDRVVGELVDAGEGQPVEVGLLVEDAVGVVADLRGRRDVGAELAGAVAVTAVTGRALHVLGAREGVRVAHAGAGVVVAVRAVVAVHAALGGAGLRDGGRRVGGRLAARVRVAVHRVALAARDSVFEVLLGAPVEGAAVVDRSTEVVGVASRAFVRSVRPWRDAAVTFEVGVGATDDAEQRREEQVLDVTDLHLVPLDACAERTNPLRREAASSVRAGRAKATARPLTRSSIRARPFFPENGRVEPAREQQSSLHGTLPVPIRRDFCATDGHRFAQARRIDFAR